MTTVALLVLVVASLSPCAVWCPVCEVKRAHVAQLEKFQ